MSANETNTKKAIEGSGKQTMQIVSVFLNDVLSILYGLEDAKTLWGQTEDNKPAFQISFPETPGNIEAYNQFVQDRYRVKMAPEAVIYDEEQKVLVFSNLDAIPKFWNNFLDVNNWYSPDAQFLTSNNNKKFIPSHPELLALKRNFYWSWQDCASNIETVQQNNKTKKLGAFTYTILDIERSLIADMRRIGMNLGDKAQTLYFH